MAACRTAVRVVVEPLANGSARADVDRHGSFKVGRLKPVGVVVGVAFDGHGRGAVCSFFRSGFVAFRVALDVPLFQVAVQHSAIGEGRNRSDDSRDSGDDRADLVKQRCPFAAHFFPLSLRARLKNELSTLRCFGLRLTVFR